VKLQYIIGAGLVLLWLRGAKKEAASTQHADTNALNAQGSDWIGAGGQFAAWDRLSGRDLTAPGYGNIAGGANADPGKIGTMQTGLQFDWAGNVVQAAA
jgi:hypothetical protein